MPNTNSAVRSLPLTSYLLLSSSCLALELSITVLSLVLSHHPKQALHLIVQLLRSASVFIVMWVSRSAGGLVISWDCAFVLITGVDKIIGVFSGQCEEAGELEVKI